MVAEVSTVAHVDAGLRACASGDRVGIGVVWEPSWAVGVDNLRWGKGAGAAVVVGWAFSSFSAA